MQSRDATTCAVGEASVGLSGARIRIKASGDKGETKPRPTGSWRGRNQSTGLLRMFERSWGRWALPMLGLPDLSHL